MSTQFKFNPFTHKLDLVGTGGGGGGGILTINSIGPDGGGNFTLESTDGSITFADVANGLDLSAVGNDLYLTKYVVDATGNAPYTTIQSAIVAANAAGGGQVVVRGGTFTEDLTFLPNVNLQGMNTDGLLAVNGGYGVIVIGNHGVNDTTGDVIFTVSNIGFQTSAGITFNLASTAHAILSEFLFCNIQNSDAAGVCFALSSAGSSVALIANNTIMFAENTIATVGTSCQYQHANTAISQAGAPAFVNNGGTLEVKNCYIGAGIILEVLGGNSILFNNQLFASNTGVLFSSAGGVVSNNNAWSSSAVSGYYIDGAAGSYQYNNDAVIGTATQINPAITQQTQVWRPRATAGTSSTAYAGTASFNSSDFTVVDGFVSSSGAGTDALITIYVVDNTNPAPYTTIQSAINAANAAGGGVVAIRPSATPYTENLSLLSQVMLIAVGQDGFFAANGSYGVSVIGNHTLNDTVGITFVQCTGIAFSSSTGVPFTMTAASTVAALELTSCAITTTGGFDGIVTSSTGGGCVVEAYALSANSSANILNLGANTEAQISNSKSLRTTNGSNAFTIAGNLNIYDCIIDVNSTCFNMVGGGCNAIGNQIIANQQGVNFTSGGGFTGFNNVWDCDGAGEYIGGAGGTYTYANDIVTGNATFISIGLTVEPQIWKPFATAVSTSMGANPGTSYFDSGSFTVDQTGYVRLVGGSNNLWLTKYVVDQAGTAPYTDIQSAINDCNAAGGGTVAIRQSTTPYVQNVNFLPLVNVCTLPTQGVIVNEAGAGVIIDGNCTVTDATAANAINIDGIAFVAATGTPLTVTSTTTSTLVALSDCSISNSDGSVLISMNGSGGNASFSSTDCYIFGSGAIVSATTNCEVTVVLCNIDGNGDGFDLNDSSVTINQTFMDVSGIGFSLTNESNLTCIGNNIEADGGIILSNDSNCSAITANNRLNCGSQYVYAGPTGGHVQYGNETYTSTTAIDPALNLTALPTRINPLSGTFALSGSATTTVTDTNVTGSSLIFFQPITLGTVIVASTFTYTTIAGTSFTVTPSAPTDTSTVGYIIFN